jgi:hypothetical protein
VITRGQRQLGGAAVTLGLAVVWACLPDLSVAVLPTSTCGNGVVDLSQGEACDPGDAGSSACTESCQISCEGGAIDPTTDHCYFWASPVQLKDNGVSECKALGAHVVHFASLQELQLVITKCKNLPGAPDSGATWVALEKGAMPLEGGVQTYTPSTGYELDLPGWSAACPGCFASIDGGDLPVGSGAGGSCVFWPRAIDQSWFQSACDLPSGEMPILCEREAQGTFSQPCADASGTCIEVRFTKGKKYYVLETTPSSFDSAAAVCRDRGGRLATFQAPEEREAVADEVARYVPAGDVWIGLLFDDEAGAWSWIDGTPAPASYPTPWGDGEPDGGSGARGVLRLAPGAYDTKLAHVQPDGTTLLPYLCEMAQ